MPQFIRPPVPSRPRRIRPPSPPILNQGETPLRKITHIMSPAKPRPTPADVREWSIAFQSYFHHPFVFDIGIRINHSEYLWVFKWGLSPLAAMLLLLRIVIGRLTVEQMLTMPGFCGYSRAPESRRELPGSLVNAHPLKKALVLLREAQDLLVGNALFTLYARCSMRLKFGKWPH